jgi:hypothetical protein
VSALGAEAGDAGAPAVRTAFGRWPGTRLGALCLALLMLPAVLAGAPLGATLGVYGFYVGWVLLPGVAFAALLVREEDELLAAGMGLVLGTVLVGLFVFVCRATGLFQLLFGWPVATLVFWALARRRPPDASASSAPVRGNWLFLALLFVMLLRVHTGISGAVEGWYLINKDLVFHGGNVAELLHTGPLTDPRVAGRPLNYHLLSHALAAGASVVSGESIADLFRFWFLGFYPMVLLMLVFALARELAANAWAGAVAALVLLLHHDLGRAFLGRQAVSPLGQRNRT